MPAIRFTSQAISAVVGLSLCYGIALAQAPGTNATPSPKVPAALSPHSGAVYEWKDAQNNAERWMEFRLWIPSNFTCVRGIVALVPGFNGDGRGMTADPEFQELAERTSTALLGVYMKGSDYAKAGQWSGAVFLRALSEMSQQTQHPEIADAPLALWGHSAGGMFNYNFVCWRPERVAAFIVNKGGYYDGPADGAALEVPGLWFAGCNDEEYRVQGVTDYFTAGRRKGAPWCLALEPNAGHELGRTKQMGIFFLETMMRLRFESSPQEATAAPAKLKPVAAMAWIGGLSQHEIRPYNPQIDAQHINSWLPDERTAKQWQAFVTGAPFPNPQSKTSPGQATHGTDL